MNYLNKNSQEGFIALISIIFFSAILSLILFIHVERLAALDDEFLHAISDISTENGNQSCAAVKELIRLNNPSEVINSSYFINFPLSLPSDISATAISCQTIPQ